MCNEKLTPEIISLLENAVKESLENFEVVVHDESAAGQGYLAEIVGESNHHVYKFIHSIAWEVLPHFFIKMVFNSYKVIWENG